MYSQKTFRQISTYGLKIIHRMVEIYTNNIQLYTLKDSTKDAFLSIVENWFCDFYSFLIASFFMFPSSSRIMHMFAS